MKKLSNYIPYLLIVVAGFAGRWTAPDKTTELEKKFALERKYHEQVIREKEAEKLDLIRAGEAETKKWKADSANFAHALRANKQAYLKLKKKYNEINLSWASVHELDSLISALYR